MIQEYLSMMAKAGVLALSVATFFAFFLAPPFVALYTIWSSIGLSSEHIAQVATSSAFALIPWVFLVLMTMATIGPRRI